MGALKIDCFLTEVQMEGIISDVAKHINNFLPDEMEDFDNEINGVRICVEFHVMLGKLAIKEAEILDSDWDLLFEDSAVFSSRLKKAVAEYNNDTSISLTMARAIAETHYW